MKKRHWDSSVFAVGLAFVVFGSVASMMSARHAKADAPPCRYAITKDKVVDNETLLTWQRAVDNMPYTWVEADMYCKALALDGGGWRLPTVQELQSIVDESKANPAIDQTVFPITQGTYFWSSVTYVSLPDAAWAVDFSYGQVEGGGTDGSARVRCVR